MLSLQWELISILHTIHQSDFNLKKSARATNKHTGNILH